MLREVSKALFSAPYRLEILLAVATIQERPFGTSAVHSKVIERLGDATSMPDKATVNRTLTSLRSAELITSEGGHGGYRRVDSRFWELVVVYGAEVEQRFAPTTLDVAG